ncbi:MAG: pseudouridine synthase [Spirochaetota bacterium]
MAYRVFPSGADDTGRRLDKVARRLLPGTKLGKVYAHIRKGRIRVNGRKRPSDYRICEGDALQVDESMISCVDDQLTQNSRSKQSGPRVQGDNRRDLPQRSLEPAIVFENEHLLCINKPRGIDVHGKSSLDTWVKSYLSREKPTSLSFRPGPVHRIDRNTTGVVFFGKTTWAQRRMSEYMRKGVPKKIYLAVLDGSLRSPTVWRDTLFRDERTRRSGTIRSASRVAHQTETTVGRALKRRPQSRARGQEAVTGVYPMLWTEEATLALCIIRSGKTHQIRAQAGLHGHPLSGDTKYEGSNDSQGYMLHALAFILPEYDKELGLHFAYAEPSEGVLERIGYRFGAIELERILESVDQAAATV